MTYAVKEVFYSLQGEGEQAGRAAVFVRFAGCNLWSGREEDRAEALCSFCDTDFVGLGPDGGRFTAAALYDRARQLVVDAAGRFPPAEVLAVFTGGEPMLHLDKALCDAFALGGFQLAIETNGTVLHPGVWAPTITVSPKAATLFNRHGEFLADDAPFKMRSGTQCKVVWPQGGLTEDDLHELRRRTRFFTYAVQPLDGGDLPIDPAHHATCVDFVRRHPEWRLSLQTHKYLAIR